MKFLNRILLLCLGLTALVACDKDGDGEGDNIKLPENLSVEITYDQNKKGLVTVKANAIAANFYTIIFTKENNDKLEIESQSGVESYEYTQSGTYSLEVRANLTTDQFINKTETIVIDLNKPIPGGPINPDGFTTPTSYPGYTLTWADEFNGTSLSSDWTHEIGTGNGGWGNNELQYYTNTNTEVRDGYLIIEANDIPFNQNSYTSSRIITQGKQAFKYGRIDIRATLPYSKGIWPALWMLGENFGTAGWPHCGEIDIMELVGGNVAGGGDNVVHGTIHWDNNGQYAKFGGSTALSTGIFATQFHVFSIIWDEQKIDWLLDDVVYNTVDITPSGMQEFHQPFFFIFNVAVGGNWPGSPDATTVFPQRMVVDYVRVFQQ